MFGILPLIFALVLAQTAEGLGPPPNAFGLSPWVEIPAAILLSCVAWCAVVALLGRVATRFRSVRLLAWWDALTAGGALGLFALWCYVLHWPALMPWSSLVQLAPYCLVLIVSWWIGGLAWSRGQRAEAWDLVAVRMKFGLLPALVALTLFDAVRWLVIEPFFADDTVIQGPIAALLGLAASFGLVFAVILVMPAVVVRLWGARPMPPGPERELIEEGCRRMGVKVRGILHWPAAGGRFYNAAAMGLIPHLRYVLFSDDLLRDLPPDQLRAVLGHELGHIRHGHLWIYLLFLIGSVYLAWSLGAPLAAIMGGLPLLGQLGGEALLGLAVVLLFVVLLRGIFGVISRACERQADLAGVELAGHPEHMRQALLAVAGLAGQPVDAPSWRHHSIRQRVAYLAHVEREPEEPQQQHRRVRGLTLAIVALLVVGLALALTNPLATGVDPEAFLAEHPAAADAVAAAEGGDWSQLSAWLAGAEQDDYRQLVQVIDLRINQRFKAHQQAVAAGTATASEAEVLYGLRGLLYPLLHHPTGVDEVDALFANNAAYAAVAGTAEPTAEDLRHARLALPLVNRAAFAGDGSAVLHDTVGCVLFRLGERQQAKRHFGYALELIDQIRGPGIDRAAFERLLRRRIAACDDPEADLPLEEPPSTPPAPAVDGV